MAKVAIIKTQETSENVQDFINSIDNQQKRKDCLAVLQMMEKISREKPMMWGKSMVGFGKIRYKSPATGREVDWFKIGFSPRKTNLSLHLTINVSAQDDLLQKLGKHKTGKGCLYINKLADIDIRVLEALVKEAVKGK